ncbi:STAS domain-containing protein [bacterium]|nr:STAS domain-containing protein [bacterium]
MEGIQVSVEKAGSRNDISIIRVGGYIDTTTSSELERALDDLLKSGVVRVIIDLGSVDYISSAGWGIFISEIKGMRERGGDLKLARMIPDVYEVFELLEFHYILKAFDTIEEAIGDFDKGKGPVKNKKSKPLEKTSNSRQPSVDFAGSEQQREEIAEEPATLEEKIHDIAIANPSWGAGRIAKELDTEEFGFVRISTITVWKLLRKINLGTKKQRLNAKDK